MEQRKRVLGTIVLLMVMAVPATAQHAGAVTGSVTDAQGLRVPGATVVVRTPGGGVVASTVTDGTGSFVIEGVSPGEYVLEVSLGGFERHEASIAVGLGQAPIAITLEVDAVSDVVLVTAPRPEMTTESFSPAPALDSRFPRDVAQSLRSHPGVNDRRSGPINLDPTIRGLSAEQIGVFVDGTRTFAAGPARMDLALSHVSPRALQRLRVVRGPYALTWGAGTLSAIRADTFKPAFDDGGDFRLGGRAGYDHGGNGASYDGFASLYGSSDRVRFAFHHNARPGSDYTDGHGATVQGDYESFDTRWDVGAWLSRKTLLEYGGGFQRQNDIEYPGRLLDAAFFATRSHALKLSHAPDSGVTTEIAGQAYANLKAHLMNNDGKPTALRDDHRTPPPFPIRVQLPTSVDTVGGRFHAALQTGPVRYRLEFESVELNVGTTFRAARAAITLDAFWRNVADYVQADAGRFAGFELTASVEAGRWIDLRGGWSYVPSRTRWIELLVTW